ncbi:MULTISPECIES: hypothetical protein [unclassified Nocardia]|uniref:hypothetical protein n=1 Tax=unclassified Nocardia TaxID=2637762 RepID=UPI001CE3CF22|nr:MULTISPECIES: hypothetical protein [unclassified Nocardia]
MADQVEVHDAQGRIYHVPSGAMREGLPPAYFDDDEREHEIRDLQAQINQYPAEEVTAARARVQSLIAAVDAIAAAGAA